MDIPVGDLCIKRYLKVEKNPKNKQMEGLSLNHGRDSNKKHRSHGHNHVIIITIPKNPVAL